MLVGADRIAANGDVVAPAGCLPARAGVRRSGHAVHRVCRRPRRWTRTSRTGGDATLEEGRPGMVLRVAGTRVPPEGTQVRNPLQDLVPSGLVTAIVTETGVLRAPFGPAIAAAVAVGGRRVGRRRAGSRRWLAAARRRRPPTDRRGRPEREPPGRRGRPDRMPPRRASPVDVAALRNPPRGPGVLMATDRRRARATAVAGPQHDGPRAPARVPRARPAVRRVRDLRPRGARVPAHALGRRDGRATSSSPSASSTAASRPSPCSSWASPEGIAAILQGRRPAARRVRRRRRRRRCPRSRSTTAWSPARR